MIAGVLGLAVSLIFIIMRRNDRRSAQVYEERRYTDPRRCEAAIRVTGPPGPIPPLPGRLSGASSARYHPPGVEQERAGLDELGRIPSEQKEKETLWLT